MKRKKFLDLFLVVLIAFVFSARGGADDEDKSDLDEHEIENSTSESPYDSSGAQIDSGGDRTGDVDTSNPDRILFYEVEVIHSGSEQVIVGPAADEASGYGFVPDEGFSVTYMALGGDGNKLWFITHNPRHPNDSDRQRLYYIDVVGTHVDRSPVPLARVKFQATFPFIHNLSTGDDGGRAVIEARRTTDLGITSSVFFDVTKGSEAFEIFDAYPYNAEDNEPYSPNEAGIRMSNNSYDVWWTDGQKIWRLPLSTINSYPDGEFGVINETCDLRPAKEIGWFDLSGGDEWTVFDIVTGWQNDLGGVCRTIIAGLRSDETVSNFELNVPFDDYEWSWATSIESVNVAGNDLAAYCIQSTGSPTDPAPCFLHPLGTNKNSPLTPVSDEWDKFKHLVLSDNGNKYRVIVSENVFAPNGRSIIETPGRHDRRLTGTRQFGATDEALTSVQLSNGGEVMAGIMADGGIYVLHDGMTGLDGFPTIESITYRYDQESDTYTFRLRAYSENGISLVRVQPMKDGIDPADYIPESENPFFLIRWGFAVEGSLVEGTSDLYELNVPMQNRSHLLMHENSSRMDESWVLRFSIVDGTGSRTVFEDIKVPPLVIDSNSG